MLTLLHKTGLVHHKHTIGVAKCVGHIPANPITKRVRRPGRTPKKRLQSIRVVKASLF
ncbi:hypothetical protein FHX16_004075 [Rhizobium sp. BK661]|nr:hypothetical protein [Rhizobium sp. BK661]